MILVAHIVPTSYLHLLAPRRMHLLLAHRVRGDARYASFYAAPALGQYRILDNSAFELGEAIDDDTLRWVLDLVRPDEIVLPDVLLRADDTMRRSEAFMERLPDTDTTPRLMGVPQGRTLEEWIGSYRYFAHHPRVYSLGIGGIYCSRRGPHFSRGMSGIGRAHLFDALLARDATEPRKPHHLLGSGDSAHLELELLSRNACIRSIDTSSAYLLARQGTQLRPRTPYEKPSGAATPMDAYSEGIRALVELNMVTLDRAGTGGDGDD